MITFDLRGHGMSERPPTPSTTRDARLRADDVDAVVGHGP